MDTFATQTGSKGENSHPELSKEKMNGTQCDFYLGVKVFWCLSLWFYTISVK